MFRISKFELRISKGKFDHFVNFVRTKKTERMHGIRVHQRALAQPDSLTISAGAADRRY